VTYYLVGLVGYLAKALKGFDGRVDPELVQGVSIPFIAGLMFYGLRKARRGLAHD